MELMNHQRKRSGRKNESQDKEVLIGLIDNTSKATMQNKRLRQNIQNNKGKRKHKAKIQGEEEICSPTEGSSTHKGINVEDKHAEEQPWTPEEDKVLTLLHNGLSKSFEDIAKFFPNRTVQSLEIRFQVLNEIKKEIEFIDLVDDGEEMTDISGTPSVTEASMLMWSLLDDMILKQSYKNFGNNWQAFLQIFPNRTIDDIKNRWHIVADLPEKQPLESNKEALQNHNTPDKRHTKTITKYNPTQMTLRLMYSKCQIGSFEWENDDLAWTLSVNSDSLMFKIGQVDSTKSSVTIKLEKSDLRQMFTGFYEDLFFIICLVKPMCTMKIAKKLKIEKQDPYYNPFPKGGKESIIIFLFGCNKEKDYYVNIESHFEQKFPGELIWSKMYPKVAEKSLTAFNMKLVTNDDQTNECDLITESNEDSAIQKNFNNLDPGTLLSDEDVVSSTLISEGIYNNNVENVTNDDQTNECNLITESNEESAMQKFINNLDLGTLFSDENVVCSTRISEGIYNNNVENVNQKLSNVVEKTGAEEQRVIQHSKRRKPEVKKGFPLNTILTPSSIKRRVKTPSEKTWTISEDKLLMKSYKKCKWNEICKLFPEKSPYALSMRVNFLKRQGYDKAKSDEQDKENVHDENSETFCSGDSNIDICVWTKEEDEKLLNSVKKTKYNWKEVATFFKGKQKIDIKERYISLLPQRQDSITASKLMWTAKEDKLLIDSYKKYDKWNTIYSFFPDRTPLSVMARVRTLKRKGYNLDKMKSSNPEQEKLQNETSESLRNDESGEGSNTESSIWTEKEDQILLNSAKRTKHDWEKVASFLKDKILTDIKERYSFLVNSKRNSRNLRKWTAEEDELLLKSYKKHKWKDIYELFPNRTEKAVCLRIYTLKQKNYIKINGIHRNQRQEEIKRKSHKNLCTEASNIDDSMWTKEEDQKLLNVIKKVGRNWSKLTLYFKGKETEQIKERYFFLTSLKQSPCPLLPRWTEEEDKLLKKFHKKCSWNEISKLLPNRSLPSIKCHIRYLERKEHKLLDKVKKKVRK